MDASIIKKRRRMLSVSYHTEWFKCLAKNAEKYAKRSRVCGLSEASAGRLRRYAENYAVDWTGMVTLTYPAHWPSSPRQWKKQLAAFFERLRRTGYFEEHNALWVLEFQKRGAPHFHILIDGWISKNWVSTAWAEITQGDPRVCSRVETLRSSENAGKYIAKYLTKSRQALLEGADLDAGGEVSTGRMWGVRKSKNLREPGRALPTVAAAIEGASPWGVERKIRLALAKVKLKVYDTPVGWVVFGTEAEINQVWLSLMAATKYVDRTDRIQEGLQHRIWSELFASWSSKEYRERT